MMVFALLLSQAQAIPQAPPETDIVVIGKRSAGKGCDHHRRHDVQDDDIDWGQRRRRRGMHGPQTMLVRVPASARIRPETT